MIQSTGSRISSDSRSTSSIPRGKKERNHVVKFGNLVVVCTDSSITLVKEKARSSFKTRGMN
jgi:hypothetical protein